MMKQKVKNTVLTALLTIVALVAGQRTWAASNFKVTNTTGTSKFVITRTTNTSTTETVYYRTVSLSAIAGQHFTDKYGSLSFDADNNSREVEVTETTPSSEVYKYQDAASRMYRLEVVDPGGFFLASCDRTISNGLTQFNSTYLNKSITDLVRFSSGNFTSGSNNKYLDVSYTPPTSQVETSGTLSGYVLIDDSYDYAQKPATVSTNALINGTLNSGTAASYLQNTLKYKIYATVCFTEKERDDGYQYVQILAGTASASYDGADSNGKIDNGPANSIYKACFELSDGSNAEGKAYFPHSGTTATEFSLTTGKLWQQAFKSDSYNGSGAIVLDPTVSNITTRFDAGGDNDDTWGYKDFFVRMALVDATAPTASEAKKVNGGRHSKGNTFYISVPFDEIVVVTGTPTLTTSWGNLSYIAGSGSNVLTFSGTISDTASGSLTISGYSGTIKDLAGNQLSTASGTISGTFNGVTIEGDYSYPITYDLAGGTLAEGSPSTYTYSTAVALNSPTRIGYTFAGWTGSNGNTPQTTVTIPIHSHGDKSYTAQWNDIWGMTDGTVGADGTEEHPYVITTTEGLDLLASLVNSGNNFAHQYFVLGADIIYDGTKNNYTAIGTSTASFAGTFDGNGHTVSGINIQYNYENQGLFGYVVSGTVKNVKLENSTIIGSNNTGGIVGYQNGGNITGCHVKSSVSIIAVLKNACNQGGIVGQATNSATVSDCISSATVTGSGENCMYYGGIVGHPSNDVTISNCLALGASVSGAKTMGAIRGSSGTPSSNYYRNVTIGDNANLSNIFTLTLPNGVTATGESLEIDGTTYYIGNTTVTFTYSGSIPEGCILDIYVKDAKNNNVAVTEDSGTYSFTMPAKDATVNCLTDVWGITEDADGSEAHPYIITTTSGLDLLASKVNSRSNQYSSTYFKLGADITYPHTTTWDDANSTEDNYTAISNESSAFLGIFDGDGHTVSGIRIYKPNKSYQGLFGRVFGATVKNVILNDARITGSNCVGGISGQMNGYLTIPTIENCFVLNTAITASYDCGAVVGFEDKGTLNNNYYRNCTVNMNGTANATGVGVGRQTGGSNTPHDQNGARSVHTLTLGTGVTATGESVEIDGTTYYVSNTPVSLTYSGEVPEGYLLGYRYNDGSDHSITGNILTMPASDVTVSVTFIEIERISVSYLDADGNTAGPVTATVLTGTEKVLNEGWYVVKDDITFDLASLGSSITLNGNVNIILKDGTTMTVTNDDDNIDIAIQCNTLSIYAQSTGDNMGSFSLNTTGYAGIVGGGVNIYGGNVSVTANRAFDLYALSITGGRVTINSKEEPIHPGNEKVALGYTATTDYISFSYQGISSGVDITIKDGQMLTDGTNFYKGSFMDEWNNFSGATLLPYIYAPTIVSTSYLDASGNTVNVNATVVDGIISRYGTSEQPTFYVVNNNVNLGADIVLDGDVNLILADGCTMSVYGLDVQGGAITCGDHTLNIYAQSTGDNMGSLQVEAEGDDGQNFETNAITVGGNGSLNIYGGNIDLWGSSHTIYSYGDISIRGGRVDLGYSTRFYGTITLACTAPTDYIEFTEFDDYYCQGEIVVPAALATNEGDIIPAGNYTNITAFCEQYCDEYGPMLVRPAVFLADNADNTSVINEWNGGKVGVQLQGRTLYKDGDWNTLCLPFDVKLSGSVLDGDNVDVRTLSSTSFDSSKGKLTLNFTNKGEVKQLTAGTPYIIKWSKSNDSDPDLTDLVNPVFANVSISNATVPVTTDYVDFTGTYSPEVYEAGKAHRNVLVLGGGSSLYYPDGAAATTIKAFRAYFQLKGITAGDPADPASTVKAFVLNFDGTETGISLNPDTARNRDEVNEAWYTVDGRKLNGKPTQRGIYVKNGKKVTMK